MSNTEITYKFNDCYDLQMIDTNCNNCVHMVRDLEKFKKWETHHRQEAEIEFNNAKQKAIKEAEKVISEAETPNDVKSGQGMLRQANKMKYTFERAGLIQYGYCSLLNKPVHFTPITCMPQNQNCFKHRKDEN